MGDMGLSFGKLRMRPIASFLRVSLSNHEGDADGGDV